VANFTHSSIIVHKPNRLHVRLRHCTAHVCTRCHTVCRRLKPGAAHTARTTNTDMPRETPCQHTQPHRPQCHRHNFLLPVNNSRPGPRHAAELPAGVSGPKGDSQFAPAQRDTATSLWRKQPTLGNNNPCAKVCTCHSRTPCATHLHPCPQASQLAMDDTPLPHCQPASPSIATMLVHSPWFLPRHMVAADGNQTSLLAHMLYCTHDL
jgi:hypothetical protein